jgi:cell division protein FtsB
MQILFVSILAIGLLLAINFSNRIVAGQRIQSIRDALEMEVATLEAEQAALQAELEYVRSDDYVASWARSQSKMVREGEVLVIPVPAGVALTTPTPVPQTPPALLEEEEPQTENWRLWWALFLDSPPPF